MKLLTEDEAMKIIAKIESMDDKDFVEDIQKVILFSFQQGSAMGKLVGEMDMIQGIKDTIVEAMADSKKADSAVDELLKDAFKPKE